MLRTAIGVSLCGFAACAAVGLDTRELAANPSVVYAPGTYPNVSTDFIRALPKIEHHMHIEGALSPELLFKLAERNNVTSLSAGNFSTPDTLWERYRNWDGLADFVAVSEQEMVVFQHERDYEDLAYSYLERSHYDGLVYAEVNFLPEGHISRGISMETVIRGLRRGLERGKTDFDIDTQLFACFSKTHNHTRTRATIDKLAPFAQAGDIIGLGAAGNEDGFPPSEFSDLYSYARSVGFQHFTIHAGETGPPSYVREAAFDLNLTRIDHAISARSEPELLRQLAEKDVFVTVCRLSNVLLGVDGQVADAPLREFLDAGVKFSLNTDDPTFLGGSILTVYLKVQEAFGFDVATWERIVSNSIDGSWTTDEHKDSLRRKLEAVMRQWDGKEL